MIFQLDHSTQFPEPHLAEKEPDGLLAVGGDLRKERLINAYRKGIFPWYSEGQPILWWSPNPRTVLYPKELHVSRSLRRLLKKGGMQLQIDQAFDQVTASCAAPRSDNNGTWLLPEMREAYLVLHNAGIAHSIELWQDNILVGGLYGMAIGRAFFGESMFSRVPSASRIVMVYLCDLLNRYQFHFLDCQVYNPHLESMGAREIPRKLFLDELAQAIDLPQDKAIWQQPPLDISKLTVAT